MKRYWKTFASRIDGCSTRERGLILVTAIIVVWALSQALLLGPIAAERKRIVQETAIDQADAGKIAGQVQVLVRDRGADPDASLRARLAQLESRMAELQQRIDAQSAELVPPERMAAVLEKILANNPRLQIMEMKTLPRTSINLDPKSPAQSEPAPPGDAARRSVDERRTNEIFRHTVEVTMRGSYLDLLAYLKEIESLPVRMFWDRVSLSVTTYPSVTMRLVVYTISLEQAWLKV